MYRVLLNTVDAAQQTIKHTGSLAETPLPPLESQSKVKACSDVGGSGGYSSGRPQSGPTPGSRSKRLGYGTPTPVEKDVHAVPGGDESGHFYLGARCASKSLRFAV